MVSEDLVNSLVGMTEAAAHEAASTIEIQVIRRDDEVIMSDMMMNDNRIKVEIEKNIVVKAYAG